LIPTGDAIGLLAINLAGNDDSYEIIDSSRTNVAESNTNNNRQNNQQQTGPQSFKVLKYDADRLQERIGQLEDELSSDVINQLRLTHKALKEQSSRIIENLEQGGKQAVEEHIGGLQQLLEHYDREEKEYRQQNDEKKAEQSLNKKKLVAEEIKILIGQSSPTISTEI